MFCPKCGRENADQNKFCNGCGETLPVGFVSPVHENVSPRSTVNPQTQIPSPETSVPEQPPASQRPRLLIVFIVLGAIGLIGTVSWLIRGKSETNQSTILNNSAAQPSTNTMERKNPAERSFEGMAFVPGGEFTMGRDDAKTEAEKPAHKVSVNSFHMDVYETTNEQYAAFIKATGNKPPIEWKNGNYPSGQGRFPVVGVNWDEANAYAKWAGKRLPTEEEWEYAARGASNLLYPWGNSWQNGNANAEGASQTFMEVGKSKGASPFGLYDMSGNAWEWTTSDFKAYPNGKLPPSFAGKTNLKTIRGGSFEATKDFATVTYRIGWAATGANSYSRTGFRCAKDEEK